MPAGNIFQRYISSSGRECSSAGGRTTSRPESEIYSRNMFGQPACQDIALTAAKRGHSTVARSLLLAAVEWPRLRAVRGARMAEAIRASYTAAKRAILAAVGGMPPTAARMASFTVVKLACLAVARHAHSAVAKLPSPAECSCGLGHSCMGGMKAGHGRKHLESSNVPKTFSDMKRY